ncbi:chromate efflux transporter [Rhodobacteraceae bacterium W635]|uniref:chromate efflux transporter n=1 Tax=Nioella halotolerans TaxID=2303578 RepID=UPI000E3BCA8B|nr:chromate efflux transporter [Rhodobacteraceae bacterium W635]
MTPVSVTAAELSRVFGRIGLLSFGGPAAQIALMHRELVEARPWLTEKQFLGALSFSMLLPGPEAMQLATYAGWRLRGTLGGLIAGGLFVLPGALVVLVLATLYARFGQVPLVAALFLGVKATVVVVVVEALLKVSRRALRGPLAYALAALAFVGLFAFDLPFPLIIAVAAGVGAVFMGQGGDSAPPAGVRPGRTLVTVLTWGALWLLPLAALWLVAPGHVLTDLGLFFSKLAVVTFGGAYAVLAYMVQEVVSVQGWLTTGQMMDALGLAETTPGPLILVTEFVGFLAGAGQGGIGMGLAAALVTLWVTFVPCFLWIFAFAPYVEWISAQPRLNGALAGITAAVVGVILNLSLWFGLNVFFDEVARAALGPAAIWLPDVASVRPGAILLALLAGWLLLLRKWDLLAVLATTAAAGAVWHLAISPVFG